MPPPMPRTATQRPTTAFRARYETVAVPALRAALGRENIHALPRITKVVVAAGTGKHRTDAKYVEDAERGLVLLTGQKPAPRSARKSFASFKVRQGQVVGLLVTLRGARMEDFLTRLIRVALPRVRDFRGIPLSAVDGRGNLSIGIREAQAFPEADPSVVATPFGLQVTLVTSARTRDEAITLYRALGMPLAVE